jgi:hypothetical protein
MATPAVIMMISIYINFFAQACSLLISLCRFTGLAQGRAALAGLVQSTVARSSSPAERASRPARGPAPSERLLKSPGRRIAQSPKDDRPSASEFIFSSCTQFVIFCAKESPTRERIRCPTPACHRYSPRAVSACTYSIQTD